MYNTGEFKGKHVMIIAYMQADNEAAASLLYDTDNSMFILNMCASNYKDI